MGDVGGEGMTPKGVDKMVHDFDFLVIDRVTRPELNVRSIPQWQLWVRCSDQWAAA
jgi:hypothetical protein